MPLHRIRRQHHTLLLIRHSQLHLSRCGVLIDHHLLRQSSITTFIYTCSQQLPLCPIVDNNHCPLQSSSAPTFLSFLYHFGQQPLYSRRGQPLLSTCSNNSTHLRLRMSPASTLFSNRLLSTTVQQQPLLSPNADNNHFPLRWPTALTFLYNHQQQ